MKALARALRSPGQALPAWVRAGAPVREAGWALAAKLLVPAAAVVQLALGREAEAPEPRRC